MSQGNIPVVGSARTDWSALLGVELGLLYEELAEIERATAAVRRVFAEIGNDTDKAYTLLPRAERLDAAMVQFHRRLYHVAVYAGAARERENQK